ncbi:PREDICTED: collagen alpha-1(III) chain-like [Bison bison bison]|uniref:Collagen alpha-1(III) chain-like n=1 Tax=Bison bison bison TaxID=43346 RepID=A0A6P3HII3_BISBB|nr:PREDICTED: collagen alpha-1(III) chain-like [Bison bison bison]
MSFQDPMCQDNLTESMRKKREKVLALSDYFVRCKPSGLGPAWQRRVPAGGRGPGAGPVAPETAGNFPPPRPRQCRGRPGGRPIGGAWTPLREGAPNPHGWSHPPHPRASGGADPQPPRRPSPALRSPRPVPQREWSRDPPGVPVPAPLCAGAEQGGADETPVRPRRARPRAPQLTGTGRAAGHYSIAGFGGGSLVAAQTPGPGPFGRPIEIGILTKHSRSRGRPAPGAPASLNPWPAGTQEGSQGAGGYPERRGWTPGGGPAGSPTPRLRRESRASVGPPASSAPHSRWPASSLLRSFQKLLSAEEKVSSYGRIPSGEI